MEGLMKQSDRTNLIREGNKQFNEGNYVVAQKYFMQANYQDGLLRIADHYYYDERKPLNALPLYIKCGSKQRIDEIYKRMAFALGKLISQDKESPKDTPEKSQNPEQELNE